MANWNTVPSTNLDPGKPTRSSDIKKINENITALAEGATGAPKIQNAAMDDDSISTNNINDGAVTTAKASDEFITADTLGDVTYPIGSMALCHLTITSSVAYGGTVSGSNLRILDLELLGTGGGNYALNSRNAGTLINVGTWKALNHANYVSGFGAGLFVRVS